MFVLHGIWVIRSGLFLWAESAYRAFQVLSRSDLSEALHPFAVSSFEIKDGLRKADIDLPKGSLVDQTQGLWLPSFKRRILPSPDLLSLTSLAPLSVSQETSLKQVQVPGVLVSLPALSSFFTQFRSTPRLRLGYSCKLLTELNSFAKDLLQRGRILPEMDTNLAGDPELTWYPTFRLLADQNRLETLTQSIPSSMLDVAHLVEAGARVSDADRARKARALAILRDLVRVEAEVRLGRAAPHEGKVWGELSRQRLREIKEWRKAFDAPAKDAYRLDLEVLEPSEGQPLFCLQATLVPRAQPDLKIPFHEALSGEADPMLADHVPGWKEQAEEWLEELTASFPEAAALREGPLGMNLAVAQKCLAEALAAWAKLGFGTKAPRFWTERGGEIRARVARRDSVATVQKSQVGLDQIVRFDWKLALDGEELTEAEMKAASQAEGGLVQLKGRWHRLDTEEVAAARRVRESQAASAPKAPLVTWLRWSVGLESNPVGLGMDLEGESVLGLLGDQEANREVTTPPSFQGSLRPYQSRGVAWMEALGRLSLGACLADDMGLGKTVQLLALLARELHLEKKVKATFLIAPTSLLGNWKREAARFCPDLKVYLHHGSQRRKNEALQEAIETHDLVLTNYQVLARDIDTLKSRTWNRVVLDEAQHIKNPDTGQSRAVRKLKAGTRIALTGTPVENRLMELWALMDFLNPGLLGSRRAFTNRFAKPIEKENNQNAAKALRGLTAPFLLRRKKTDPELLPELPEKIEQTLTCTLSKEQATLYQATVEEVMTSVEEAVGMARRGLVLSALTRLKQVCNHPAQALKEGPSAKLKGRSGKMDLFEELVSQVLDAEESLLCFTQYREMGELLQARLKQVFDFDSPFLHGGVSRAARDEMVRQFQEGKSAPVLILSLKAGGTGLNLTSANHVVHYDRWWNPAVEDQASDRAFRMGQQKNVMVHRLVCQGTLEEKVDLMLENKRSLANQVVGSGESWFTEIATDELRSLVSLSAAG